MFELLLLFFYLMTKWKVKKSIKKINSLVYAPTLITVKEVQDAVEEMDKNSFQAAMLIYTQILSLLGDKTVVQIQMYGIGNIWRKGYRDWSSRGTFQLAVAFKLFSKFKNKFSEISITSQEPCHLPFEIGYLKNRNVHVFERTSYSPNYFINTAAKSNVSKPVMIVYMIYFKYNEFEKFLEAHWDPKILSQIIFVGNGYSDHWYSANNSEIKRINEYMKYCEIKTLPLERPEFDNDPIKRRLNEWPPFKCHPSEFLTYKCFNNIEIQSISYDNAKKLCSSLA